MTGKTRTAKRFSATLNSHELLSMSTTGALIVMRIRSFQQRDMDCYLSYQQFAEDLGVSVKTIKNELAKLKGKKQIGTTICDGKVHYDGFPNSVKSKNSTGDNPEKSSQIPGQTSKSVPDSGINDQKIPNSGTNSTDHPRFRDESSQILGQIVPNSGTSSNKGSSNKGLREREASASTPSPPSDLASPVDNSPSDRLMNEFLTAPEELAAGGVSWFTDDRYQLHGMYPLKRFQHVWLRPKDLESILNKYETGGIKHKLRETFAVLDHDREIKSLGKNTFQKNRKSDYDALTGYLYDNAIDQHVKDCRNGTSAPAETSKPRHRRKPRPATPDEVERSKQEFVNRRIER